MKLIRFLQHCCMGLFLTVVLGASLAYATLPLTPAQRDGNHVPVMLGWCAASQSPYMVSVDGSGNVNTNFTPSGTQTVVPNAVTTANGYSYTHLSAAGNTTVKSGAGFLHCIVENNTGTGDLTTVYDNTAASGTVIGIVGPSTETTFTYDVSFSTGLTVSISSVTTAPDLTVCWK